MNLHNFAQYIYIYIYMIKMIKMTKLKAEMKSGTEKIDQNGVAVQS